MTIAVRKYFRLQCIVRVLAIAATLLLLLYLAANTALYASMAIVTVLAVAQMWGLIRYVESTNRQLLRFLEAVQYADSSQHFAPDALGSSFQELSDAFNKVLSQFQHIRSEKEEQYQAVQTILQHVGIGLLSFDQHGAIDFINPAARKLLNIPHLRFIRDLERHVPSGKALAAQLSAMQAGEKALVKLVVDDELLQIVVASTKFRMSGREFTLVSLQNIVSELEEKEMEAWQMLIRVLTHEIMNSIAPISSLSDTINSLLSQDASALQQTETVTDIRSAAQTIHKRSIGLMRFVENYRNLTRVPKPDFKLFVIAELFATIHEFLRPRLEAASVTLVVDVQPPTLELTADEKLLEQTLINLVINAIHALEGKRNHSPTIRLTARLNERGRVVMYVADNGAGIVPSALEKIFIPFFTTKPDGSGIGLSLARQIMRLHGGSITAQSQPEHGTTFTLRF